MRLRALLPLVLIVAVGCIHKEPKGLREAAVRNRARIQKVALGQSPKDVETVLGPPERREATRTSRGDVDTWSYLTDYDRVMMTKVVFVNGKVTEIREEKSDEP